MNSHTQNDQVMTALTYTNRQIDNFVERQRLTFAELALIVEAVYAMCNISGSLVLAYALVSRSKALVLDSRGFFTVQDVDSKTDHVLPAFLRDLPFYMENKIKYELVNEFVPLFSLGLGANTVVLKNTIWLRSRERTHVHLPILLGSEAMDAAQVQDNRHASVTVPIVHLLNDSPVCSLLQLPASTFDKVYRATLSGNVALQLNKAYGRGNQSHPELVVKPFDPRLSRDNVHPVVGPFWKAFEEYAAKISEQNAKMPKHVIDAITHTLINTQKSLPELSQQLF